MSVSTTALANEALSLVRAKNKIADIDTDTDPNAVDARMFLNAHIHELLEEIDLKAFSVTRTLDDITDSQPPPAGWTYRYAWPATCMVPRQVIIAGFIPSQTPIEFEEELLNDGSARSLLCQEPSASLRFTTDSFIENVSRWPWNFRRAVIHRLAASMATSIKATPAMATVMMNFYVDSAMLASHVNHSGHRLINSQAPGSIRARRGVRI